MCNTTAPPSVSTQYCTTNTNTTTIHKYSCVAARLGLTQTITTNTTTNTAVITTTLSIRTAINTALTATSHTTTSTIAPILLKFEKYYHH